MSDLVAEHQYFLHMPDAILNDIRKIKNMTMKFEFFDKNGGCLVVSSGSQVLKYPFDVLKIDSIIESYVGNSNVGKVEKLFKSGEIKNVIRVKVEDKKKKEQQQYCCIFEKTRINQEGFKKIARDDASKIIHAVEKLKIVEKKF